MVNLEHKLTVDDLIIEYMMYKVKNGYKPSFLASEFMNFLYFFESKMQVEDSLYDEEQLFKRFYERKFESDWSYYRKAHMDMIYSKEVDEYLIKANYDLSDYDSSVINTNFMDEKAVIKIRNIIGQYLAMQSKRKIDETVEIKEEDLMIGKYLSAEVITQIWSSYIDKQIERERWPMQCRDINKYLFNMDLAKIIEVESIKDELVELYNALAKRVAILCNQDKNLKVISHCSNSLAYSNYMLLIRDFEEIIGIAFDSYKKTMVFDLAALTFVESHELGGCESEIRTTTFQIGNDNAQKLIRTIEKK